jgi:hypothetical protein
VHEQRHPSGIFEAPRIHGCSCPPKERCPRCSRADFWNSCLCENRGVSMLDSDRHAGRFGAATNIFSCFLSLGQKPRECLLLRPVKLRPYLIQISHPRALTDRSCVCNSCEKINIGTLNLFALAQSRTILSVIPLVAQQNTRGRDKGWKKVKFRCGRNVR